jgi:NF-kappa-B-activating protein C-terminal domain
VGRLDEIAKYEDVGYVMSGSHHRRMNAVRMWKGKQATSAEEKWGILKLQKEEREAGGHSDELVAEKLKGACETKMITEFFYLVAAV